jgi:hypothetical protein
VNKKEGADMQPRYDRSAASLEEAELDDATYPQLPLIELETLLNRPPSWRKRWLHLGVLLCVLLVTLLTCWNVLPFGHPVNATRAAPGATSRLFITSNVTAGTLTLNGRPHRVVFPIQLALQSQAPLVVTLSAPPFSAITCQVPPTHPTRPGAFNPCVLSAEEASQEQPSVVRLSILLGLDALPPPLQLQALTFLPWEATAQATITVSSRAYIALGLASDGAITSQLTKVPLKATASLAPSLLTTLQGDPFCDGKICYAPLAAAANTAPFWAITVPVVLRWQFTNAGGQVVSSVAYPVIEGWQVSLTYASATGWYAPMALNTGGSATRKFSNLSCETGAALLQAQIAGMGWTIRVAHQAGIEGCQLVGQQTEIDRAVFLWRFGVLLAVDAPAHRLLPTLPLAQPADTAAPGV